MYSPREKSPISNGKTRLKMETLRVKDLEYGDNVGFVSALCPGGWRHRRLSVRSIAPLFFPGAFFFCPLLSSLPN